MLSNNQRFAFNDVVIIADILSNSLEIPIDQRRDLERSDVKTLRDLNDSISRLGKKTYHYQHPKELAKNAVKHVRDIIFSIFGGAVSRNRMALVPAICETFGLSFVGPDTYGRIICQDKEVSKSIASTAGLRTAPHRIIRKEKDIEMISDFPLPYVVKPLWEGSSIGISPKNLVTNHIEGKTLLRSMLIEFKQPIMVELFIPGREVSWCFIESSETNQNRAFAEMIWNNEPDHFDKNLYDAQHKLISEGRKIIHNIDCELSHSDAEALEKMLQMIGHIGYGRIDGKFTNGQFVFLEVTPDAWIGSTGTFATSFINKGMTFDEIIAHVLLSAQINPQNQLPNG